EQFFRAEARVSLRGTGRYSLAEVAALASDPATLRGVRATLGGYQGRSLEELQDGLQVFVSAEEETLVLRFTDANPYVSAGVVNILANHLLLLETEDAQTLEIEALAEVPNQPVPLIELPRDMFFQNYGVNPFVDTREDNQSTFAMDVDSAAYTLARNYLNSVGALPPADAIRTEEFVNYFDYAYAPPGPEDPAFRLHLDAAPAPFGADGHYLLRVGIQGREIDPTEREPLLLVFVIDVSGSMADGNRLELVKASLRVLLDALQPEDRVGIITYTDYATPVLFPTPVAEKATILAAIDPLVPLNSTNAEAGLVEGYNMAETYALDGQTTRVILLSDGVANVGNTSAGGILERIANSARRGITLTSVGVGMGNYNDVLLEQLANNGDGNYYYVDTLQEAQRVFTENLAGTLFVIGYDAKVQVEFNPEAVARYRLMGYENRDVADADFRNDSIDAGEVGAGHSVTALYEFALEPLTRTADRAAVLATVTIRYEDANTGEVVEVAQPLTSADLQNSIREAPANLRLAASVAEFAELLRQSFFAEDGNYVDLLSFAQGLAGEFPADDAVAELLELIRTAGRLVDQ
ncbi:MAG: DUF3520 domain-containing protein, partial [Anaerolineae bacterium]|nr:DUF3520 domain-containing protein [Anaerolineae bacterium]